MKPRHAVPVLFATTVCLWSALAGPSAARTEVSIRGRNITITVPIDAVGIDRSTAREWKRSAESMWNDAFNSDDNPFKGCINLKLELDIDIRGWSDAARPGRHMIFGSRGATPNQPAGTIQYNGNPYQSSADGNFDEMLGDGSHSNHIAHEVGHLLGLPDEYKVISTSPRRTEPLDGRKNTLMADGGRIDPALLKRLVNRLRNETHNIPDCWKGTFTQVSFTVGRDVYRTRADIVLDHDGKGNLTGTMTGQQVHVDYSTGGCSFRMVQPNRFRVSLVGSFTERSSPKERPSLKVFIRDIEETVLRAEARCDGGRGGPIGPPGGWTFKMGVWTPEQLLGTPSPLGEGEVLPDGTRQYQWRHETGGAGTAGTVTLHRTRN